MLLASHSMFLNLILKNENSHPQENIECRSQKKLSDHVIDGDINGLHDLHPMWLLPTLTLGSATDLALANGTSANMMQIRLDKCLHVGTGPSEMLLPHEEVRASLLKTQSPAKSQHPMPSQVNEAIIDHAAPVKPPDTLS